MPMCRRTNKVKYIQPRRLRSQDGPITKIDVGYIASDSSRDEGPPDE